MAWKGVSVMALPLWYFLNIYISLGEEHLTY